MLTGYSVMLAYSKSRPPQPLPGEQDLLSHPTLLSLLQFPRVYSSANQSTTSPSPPAGPVHNPLAADFRLPRHLSPSAELRSGGGSSSSEGLARKHSGSNSNHFNSPTSIPNPNKTRANILHTSVGGGRQDTHRTK